MLTGLEKRMHTFNRCWKKSLST